MLQNDFMFMFLVLLSRQNIVYSLIFEVGCFVLVGFFYFVGRLGFLYFHRIVYFLNGIFLSFCIS